MTREAGTGEPEGAPRTTDGTQATAADLAELVPILGQAYVTFLTGGLRYGGRLLDAGVRYQSQLAEQGLMEPGGTPSSLQRARLVENARAALREAAEITSQEARLMQAELERLDAELRRFGVDEQPLARARRFARAKD